MGERGGVRERDFFFFVFLGGGGGAEYSYKFFLIMGQTPSVDKLVIYSEKRISE